jgi:hypothetical protein
MAYPYIASWLPFLDSSRVCAVYDYKFERTAEHLSDEDLEKYRWSYDELAARAIDRLEGKKQSEEAPMQKPNPYEQLQCEATLGEDSVITKFWNEAHSVPDWVDWDAIGRGQDVSLP